MAFEILSDLKVTGLVNAGTWANKPSAPLVGQRYLVEETGTWRNEMEFVWNSARWVSNQIHHTDLKQTISNNYNGSISSTTMDAWYGFPDYLGNTNLYKFQAYSITVNFLLPTSDTSNYWRFDFHVWGGGNWYLINQSYSYLIGAGVQQLPYYPNAQYGGPLMISIDAVKVGTPTTLYIYNGQFNYRLIG
jgi:hypothetical protein